MKKYLKTPEEVVDALKEGKTVYAKKNAKYKLYNGMIIGKDPDKNIWAVGAYILDNGKPYIKKSEPFKIEVGKFYKTRDGKKARCFLIQANVPKFCVDNYGIFTTDMNGKVFKHYEEANDIIGPWEEE